MSCQITLSLISYLPNELNWGPITTALRHLEKWRRILKYSECFLMLTEFVKSILLKPSAEVGWNNTGKEEIRLLRPEVLLASVLWEDSTAISHAKQLLQNHLNNSSAVISPNLREVSVAHIMLFRCLKSSFLIRNSLQVVYTGAVLSGEYQYWQFCWTQYSALRSHPEASTERLQLLRALGKTKDAW